MFSNIEGDIWMTINHTFNLIYFKFYSWYFYHQLCSKTVMANAHQSVDLNAWCGICIIKFFKIFEVVTFLVFLLPPKYFFFHDFTNTVHYGSSNWDYKWLTQCDRDKIATIFHVTFSNGFSWMKMFEFRLKFCWSLFLRVLLTVSRHCFR